MTDIVYIAEDLVSVKIDNSGKKVVLAWGDPVEALGFDGKRTQVRVLERGAKTFTGTVRGKLKTQVRSVLKLAMVDVQQGDGMVLETPLGRKLFIDGGDNPLFARYVAARYRGTTAEKPLQVDAMIVTHGDADHFSGLKKIMESETHKTARKRVFIHPLRVFHNGLVKGPSKKNKKKVPDTKMFGQTVKTAGGGLAVISLEEDLLKVPKSRMNNPFKGWIKALRHWAGRGPIEFRRLAFGDDDAFDFLKDEGIKVELHGPIETRVTHAGKHKPGLKFLHTPPKAAELHLHEDADETRAFSASHTINGHSLAFRLVYGNVRFYFSGDMNHESMVQLRKRVDKKDMQSEVLKVPHHGSADFDLQALKDIAPIVSLISSGDESSRKEHIHPRATVMGALGRAARQDTSLVFCTELAAFFAVVGLAKSNKTGKTFFGFERTNFGIIHVRTDGERVLVFTHSGKAAMKEAYRFTVDSRHRVAFANKVKTR